MSNSGDMRRDLLDTDEFRALLADDGWAQQIYLMFPNREWRNGLRRFSMSWRAAGSFVAEARGLGEDYVDYYMPHCWGDLVEDAGKQERLAEVFAAAGWREVGSADRAEFFLDGLRKLAVAEKRPAAEVPDWYRAVAERHPEPADVPAGLTERVHYFARKGMLASDEFAALVSAFMISSEDWPTVMGLVAEARDRGEDLPPVEPARYPEDD